MYQIVTEGSNFSPPPLPAEEEEQNFPFCFIVRQGISLVKTNYSVIFLKSTDEGVYHL
jgi:hypothetical protein